MSASSDHNDGDKKDVIFGHLPAGLFGILGSSARRGYARLLLAIYREFFGENYTNAVRKEDLIAFISLKINELSDILEEFASESHSADVSQNPNSAYLRLKKSEWLVEHKRGYVAMVDLDASVSMVLETLSSIEEGEAVHFGGTIAAIESVIERLEEDPFDKASSLADSAQRSRRFQQHLSAIIGNLRAHEQKIIADPQPAKILANFFHFVEEVLIADYRAIKTTNNPFRHRSKILLKISGYEHSPEIIEQFVRGYVAQGLAPNEEVALQKVRQHLHQVKRVFDAAEERLDEIDAFRSRLEQRIARTISYMTVVDSAIIPQLSKQMKRLAALPLDWEDIVDIPSDLTDPVRAWGPDSLARPTVRRVYAMPTAVEADEIDPAMEAYDRVQKAYLLKLSITPAKVADYIERNMASRNQIEGHEFEVSDTEEALLLQGARQLDMMGSRELASRFRVVREAGRYMENDWYKFTAFTVERVIPILEGSTHGR